MLAALVLLGFAGLMSLASPVRAAEGSSASAPAAAKVESAYSRERTEDTCTREPRSEWLPEAEMRLLAEFRGYRIKTFKVANGSCYEVYGFDQSGQIVEVYFNPVNAKLVRKNIAR